MSRSRHCAWLLLSPLITTALLACQDNVTSSQEGCEGLSQPCPEGSVCRLDEIGNPYCDGSPEAPLNLPGGGIEPSEVGGAGDSGGASSAAGAAWGGAPSSGAGAGGGLALEGGASSGPSGGDSVTSCTGFSASLKPAQGSIPEVMLVVDRSYSMVSNDDRWSPAVNAMATVMQSLEEGVAFGLTLFPDPIQTSGDLSALNQCTSWGRDPLSCEEDIAACAPGRVMLEPALNNAVMIQEQLSSHRPRENLGTPTYSALQAAGDALLGSANGGSKVIILITDGMPGCNFQITPATCTCLTPAPFFCQADQFAGMCLDDQRTTSEVARLAGLGIQTVVVGMTLGLPPEGIACINGSGCPYGGQGCVNGTCVNLAPSVLSEMARSGGEASGGYYSVADLNEISAQITQAAAGFAPCVFDLPSIPEEAYGALSLYIDGELVSRDEGRMNGWWAEGGQLELFGEACASIRDGQAHRVSARCE